METIIGNGKAAPPAAPERTDFEKTADALYAPVQEQTEPGEFYSLTTTLRPAFKARDGDLAEVLGLTSEERAARQRAFTEDWRATDLDAYRLGPRVYDLEVDADVAAARGTYDATQVEANIRQWNEETRQQLRSTYGAEEAESLMARMRKFVAANPGLSARLGRHGIGSRPDVVIPIAEYIRRVDYR